MISAHLLGIKQSCRHSSARRSCSAALPSYEGAFRRASYRDALVGTEDTKSRQQLAHVTKRIRNHPAGV